MHIVVLLAGVADPKQPLPRPPSGDWRGLGAEPGLVLRLSPFDEAALETALKLRTGAADVALTVLVTHGARDTALLRTVAAFRPDRIAGLDIPASERWNPAALAERVTAALAGLEQPADLVIIGREHGDTDDGMCAPYLADALDWPFVGQALNIRVENGKPVFEKVAADMDESITLSYPALASITNHKGNRLRHPLLKNVLHAKQQKFDVIELGVTAQAFGLASAEPAEQKARGGTPCRILQGSLADQAQALASYLKTRTHPGPDAAQSDS
jgi:electron transfer flavoprotein beta subunit